MEADWDPRTDCDVLVIGSGAGGMAAAATAARPGLKVQVVEKASRFGGTTAISGGWLWIPNNPVSIRAGFADSAESIRTYIIERNRKSLRRSADRSLFGKRPKMVGFFETDMGIPFLAGQFPDYHPDTPSAAHAGRAICAAQWTDASSVNWRAHFALLCASRHYWECALIVNQIIPVGMVPRAIFKASHYE